MAGPKEAYCEAWKGVFQPMCLNMFKGTRNCATPPGEIVTRSNTQIAQGVNKCLNICRPNVSAYGFKPFKHVGATSGVCLNTCVCKHFWFKPFKHVGATADIC